MATKLRHDPAESPRKRNKFMLKIFRIITKHIRAMINELRSFRQLELLVRQHGDARSAEELEQWNQFVYKANIKSLGLTDIPH